MLEKANESILHLPFLLLLPFAMLVSDKSNGWHKEKINKEEISYQIYIPANIKDEKMKVTILLKEKGGRLTSKEAVIIKENAEQNNTVFIIPKNQKDWKSNDANNLKKVVENLDKYKNIDESKISIISQNSANVVAIEYICNNPIEKATLINLKSNPSKCQGNIKEIELSDKSKTGFWKNQVNKLSTISQNSAFDYLKIKP